MRRIAVLAAVAALVLAGCKKPEGPQTTEVTAPDRPADELTPAGGEVAEVPEEKPVETVKPAPKEEAPEPAEKVRTYVVQRRDTLWSIAKKFYGDASRYKEIAKFNNIKDPNRIRVGQVLKIPK